jgi:chromate transporter
MNEGGGDGRPPSLFELLRVYLKISLLGFGGPNAHLALMLDEVVERRRWITHEHFLHLVGVTNLLPGPNSSEVAIHVGYTQRGWHGALVTGLAFVVPTFCIVLVLSWLYFRFGAMPRAEGVLWGIKPAVLAVIVWAAARLGRTAVRDAPTAALALLGAVVAWVAGGWEVAAMVVGGLVTWLRWRGRAEKGANGPPSVGGQTGPPRSAAAIALLAVGTASFGTLGAVFLTHLWIGSVLFGGGYVLVALLQPYAVERYQWLTAAQFLDGVAITQAIPGPISTLTTFVGFGAAGVPGAALATVGLYLPSFVAVLSVAPHMARLREGPAVKAALEGVSAVVAGAIVGVAAGLFPTAVPDVFAGLLFVAALVVLARLGLAAGWVVLGGLVVGLARAAVF